jgi:hypothetical protein
MIFKKEKTIMKAKIAAILMSWAVALGGSTEAKPIPVYQDEVPETVEIENIEAETKEIETIEIENKDIEHLVREEHEGEILEVKDSEEESQLKKALNATRVTIADKAIIYWDDVCTTFDDLGDKITFWD